MTVFAPFELFRGERVAHDTTSRPRHRKSDWDTRCEACQRAKAYVQTLTARMRSYPRTWR